MGKSLIDHWETVRKRFDFFTAFFAILVFVILVYGICCCRAYVFDHYIIPACIVSALISMVIYCEKFEYEGGLWQDNTDWLYRQYKKFKNLFRKKNKKKKKKRNRPEN